MTQFSVLSVAPFNVIPPPSAVVLVGVATEPSSMFLSSTEIVVELTVVVVPLIVTFPVTVRSPPTDMLSVVDTPSGKLSVNEPSLVVPFQLMILKSVAPCFLMKRPGFPDVIVPDLKMNPSV